MDWVFGVNACRSDLARCDWHDLRIRALNRSRRHERYRKEVVRGARHRWAGKQGQGDSSSPKSAAAGLQDYVGQILIPTEKVLQIRNGKKVRKERNLFPGYVFVECCPDW